MADGASLGIPFDFTNPDYLPVFEARLDRLRWLRANPDQIPLLKAYYRDHIAQFITDWGCTFDPRNVERGLPAYIPFVLFQRQTDWVEWVIDHWRSQTPGLTEKSRDMGVSWLAMAAGCGLCLFNDGMAIGYGSRKEEYVDRVGSPKSLFHRGRMFMRALPPEFRGGFSAKHHAPFMRIMFPETGSIITGEAGDNIGRGDRVGIEFVDEHAYLEHPDTTDAALSQTTNCQIDMSSVNGMANAFAQKRHKPGMPDNYVFVFDWRDDPRKQIRTYNEHLKIWETWYEKQCRELDPVIVAQEIDRDYAASVEGVIIPGAWARAALDFAEWAGLSISGEKSGALDIADEGRDKNAFCGAHGFQVERIEEWSGKGSDIFATVEQAFAHCDELGYARFRFDSDGLGAGARGDARKVNEARQKTSQRFIEALPFRGSAAVFRPEAEDEKGRKNEDFFLNAKSQGWWNLRRRFRNTFRWRTQGMVSPVEDIISISTKCGNWTKLVAELSQATYSLNGVGKMLVDKTPDGAKSPNMADAVMIRFAPLRVAMRISDDAVKGANR